MLDKHYRSPSSSSFSTYLPTPPTSTSTSTSHQHASTSPLQQQPLPLTPHQTTYTDEFYQACVNGDFELACCLLKMGVNLNVRFEHGQNLLHIACMKNFYGLVQLLIKFGCNEFMRDNFGRTALHYAAASNSTSIVRYLVEKNTFSNDHTASTDMLTKQFLNTQDAGGKSAIHLACEKNFKEPILIMLSSGQADLNLEESSEARQTPLMIAYVNKHWEIFELLVKNGANVNKCLVRDMCARGNTAALTVLQRYFNNKSLACLIADEQTGNSNLYVAMKCSENLEFVTKLFELGVKLNKSDLVDYYNELKMFNYLSKTITVNTFGQYLAKFQSHVEYLILMFKHYSFIEQVALSNGIELLGDLFTEFNLNAAEVFTANKSNIIDYIILFYVTLVHDVYAHLISLKMKGETVVAGMQAARTRINFLFALVVFSAQLNVRQALVLRWFEARLLTGGRLLPRVGKMFAEATGAPWSLQALCRSAVRTGINNIEYVLSDRSLIKNLNLPDIYVRYLKFEFI